MSVVDKVDEIVDKVKRYATYFQYAAKIFNYVGDCIARFPRLSDPDKTSKADL